MEEVGDDLCQVELKVGNPDDVQPDSKPLLLLNQKSAALHDQQCQVGQHQEEGAVLGNNAHPFHESAGLAGEIGEGEVDCPVGVVVVDDAAIDVVLELYSDEVFGVALFEVAHVAHPVVEGEVVDEGVEVKVEVLGIAGDVEVAHSDGGVAAENQN